VATATVDLNELLEVREDFRDGRPCLRGTGITVHTIAAHRLQGMTPEEILDGFPRATLAGIHAALAYYYAHREQVDADFDEDERIGEELIAEQERSMPWTRGLNG
jgi:uncharacterized protein (DUF433 family)